MSKPPADAPDVENPELEDSKENISPLEPSGLAQFIEHDRCQRFLSQRIDPEPEADARPWKEAFGLMNIALLGTGGEFEATQMEALAENATRIIGPELADQSKAVIPDVDIDETWNDSTRGRREQITTAVENAATLSTTGELTPYILLYQAPLSGILGEQPVYGDADCIVLTPADAVDSDGSEDSASGAVARIIDCKSAEEEQSSHRIQIATYCALFEQILGEESCDTTYRIEASVLTQPRAAADNQPLFPFELPTFRHTEWQMVVSQLLNERGPVTDALDNDLEELAFSIDPVCNNCAYQEACATRAVERPQQPQSLAMLGLDASSQRSLREAGLTSLHDVATLCHPQRETAPMDDPPQLDIDPDLQRTLEETVSVPVHELVIRAQALYSRVQPMYPEFEYPPAIPGNDWVPLPDDRCAGWSNIDNAEPGELIHVALFVRPDSAINRIATLGACVTAENFEGHLTIGEVIEALPDDESLAADLECSLFDRFLSQLFDTIERVATELGNPEQAVPHFYTYSKHELEALTNGVDRHSDSLDCASAFRALCSLHEGGHTGDDQSMITPVQPVINDHFALASISQGLLSVVDQFDDKWTAKDFDPPSKRPNAPLLRNIFHEQFLNDNVPYFTDDHRIRLDLAPESLDKEPAAEAIDREDPDPDGWYRVRQRSGGQFPIEYIWAAVPQHPDDDQSRLNPDVADEWAVDDEHRALYRREINRFYYRTDDGSEPIQRTDVEYLVRRLSYSLQRLIEAIPYKNAYHPKEPIDVTKLKRFELPDMGLPDAVRDVIRIEAGARQDKTIEHYRNNPRDRVRGGRSLPIRCIDYSIANDDTLTIRGELAYDALFKQEMVDKVAQRIRVRGSDGTSGGSWRVLTRLANTPDLIDHDLSGRPEATIDKPEEIKYSPPVIIEDVNPEAGTVVLTAMPHRLQSNGSYFRVDHCGWQTPTESNVEDPDQSPSNRDGYVAQRPPVQINTGDLYILDPMTDNLGAPKADRALRHGTIEDNALWQHLQVYQRTGRLPPVAVAPSANTEEFLEKLAAANECLTPNSDQQRFIEAIDRPIVPLQGPPGTGKTSGAIAPALLARAYARSVNSRPFTGLVVAPSHEAVDATLEGVVSCLDDWLAAHDTLDDLELVRVLPTAPTKTLARADTDTASVDVTYCAYHSDDDTATIRRLANAMAPGSTSGISQQLLFTTPPTLYQVISTVAETLSAIDGTSAPAAMRYPPGLIDVVCLDEASMLDLSQLFLATSVLRRSGQTLVVGDHRQLSTVTEYDWEQTRRKPIEDLQASQSALEYFQELKTSTDIPPTSAGGGDDHQTSLPMFSIDDDNRTNVGGDE